MRIRWIAFCLIILLSFNGFSQENGWLLEKESAGIAVYTREVETTKVREFRATGTINSPAHEVVKILKDVPNYPRWIEDVHSSRILANSKNKLSFYYELHLPWPITNRDIAMNMLITTDSSNTILLELTSNNNIMEEASGFIRMTDVYGYWKVSPLNELNCKVTYQFLADPGGNLPSWVINLFIVDGPFKTLQNLDTYAVEKNEL